MKLKHLVTAATALAVIVSVPAAVRAGPDASLDGDVDDAAEASDAATDTAALRPDSNDASAEQFDAQDTPNPNLDIAYTSPGGCTCTIVSSANDSLPPTLVAAALAVTCMRRRRK